MSTPFSAPTARLLYRARHPALETRWLARHDRQLPVPEVFYVSGITAGGFYFQPLRRSRVWEGLEVPPSRGLIMVNVDYGPSVPAILAHEFRHHWQRFHGWRSDTQPYRTDLPTHIALRRFYRASRSEMDALRHEMRRAPNEESRWLLSLTENI